MNPSHQHESSFRADDGEEIQVWQHGQHGPAIVFLHGWTASHLEWSPFIHALEGEHRLFRWNARAHAGRPVRGAPATAARMARDLANTIHAYGLEGACFVGHSMGALTLWQYLQDFGSAELGSLCLIDQSPRLLSAADWPFGIYGDFSPARSAAFSAELREDFAEAVLRLAALGLNAAARSGYGANGRGWQRTREALRLLPAADLIACWEDLVGLDLRAVVPRIDKPTLLVYGGCSNFYPVGIAHWLQARIPQAELSIHQDANHSPHLMDAPRFCGELSAFVAGTSR